MAANSKPIRRLVWTVVGLAIAGGVGWWTWVRAKPPVLAAVAAKPGVFVQVSGSGTGQNDRVLRERAELFDPTPLFFPTEWNYGQRPLRLVSRRETAQVFASIDPQFSYPEQGPKFYGAEPQVVTDQVADVASQGSDAPFGGIGHVDVVRTALEGRKAFVEVTPMSGGKPVLSEAIKELVLQRADYAPLEFLVLVNVVGAVGDPVLAVGSGVEEVDAFFRNYLVKTYRIGERLPPGRYRVWIGP